MYIFFMEFAVYFTENNIFFKFDIHTIKYVFKMN